MRKGQELISGKRQGTSDFIQDGSGKGQECLYKLREFLNPCSKPVKNQGILSQGYRKLFCKMF